MSVDVCFVKEFFSKLDSKGITYCVLRNADEILHGDAHDIDLAVDFLRYDEVFSCLRSVSGKNWKIHRMVEKDNGNLVTVNLYTLIGEKPILLHFDFFKAFSWNGYKLISYSRMLVNREKKEWLYEAESCIQAVTMLFSRLLYHGCVKAKYRPYISKTFNCLKTEVKSLMNEFLPMGCVNAVYDDVLNGDWENIESEIYAIRRNVKGKVGRCQKYIHCKSKLFALKRMMHCIGLTVYMPNKNDIKLAQIKNLLSRTFQPEDFKIVSGGGTISLRERVWLSQGYLLIKDKKPAIFSYVEVAEEDTAEKAATNILKKLSGA